MQIITPVGLANFAYVHKAQPPMDPTKQAQFSLTLVWDKNNEKLAALKKAINEVAVTKFGAKATQMLEKGQLKNPLRDGNTDRPADPAYAGKVFLTARSTDKPGLVDLNAEPILSPEGFYSGCEARMDIWVYAFEKAGNRGVAAILNNVQKTADGERLSGRRSAEEAFANDELL